MPIIEWNVSFLVGIPEIDQQHQQLVQLTNRTYDGFRSGADIEPSVIDELVAHASEHFACEEGWMAESCYPKLAEHREEHQLFTCRIMEFKSTYQQKANISVELLWFLCNWVTHHIRETDAKFGEFVDMQNIRKRMSKMK
jgi:hemerythrin